MKSQVLNIFPLSIYRSNIEIPNNIKEEMIREVNKMREESIGKKIITEDSSWTGDTHGHEYLYENKKFNFFFKEVEKHIKNYVAMFDIDTNKLDFYFQRSWATVSKGKQNIKAHAHKQSHISFAFYLKKGLGDSNIQFIDTHCHNEFLTDLFSSPSISLSSLFTKRTTSNSSNINVEPNENDIIIFPSKTMHGTLQNIDNDERISISADVSITGKNTSYLEQLITPVSKWKKF